MSQPIFQNYPIADVSTKYVTAADGQRLLNPEEPSILGVLNRGTGALLFLGVDGGTENARQFAEAGWSEAMCGLVRAVTDAGYEYLRIDADGSDIQGGDFPTFDW